jgi:hypothetical protein
VYTRELEKKDRWTLLSSFNLVLQRINRDGWYESVVPLMVVDLHTIVVPYVKGLYGRLEVGAELALLNFSSFSI